MPSRRGSARSKGLVFACIVAIAFIGIIGWMVLTRPKHADLNSAEVPAEPPPDVRNVAAGAGQAGTIAGAGRLFLQVVDPKDPTRVEAEITAERSEPLGNRRIRMDSPRAWLYFKSGRSMHIRAQRGETTLPESGTGGRPEDAILDGDVQIRMFEAIPGQLRPDSENDAPILTFKTPRFRMDAQRGELEAPGVISARSKWLDFDGDGLTVLYNDKSRVVEFLRVASTRLCSLHGEAESDLTTAKPPPAPSAPATGKPGSTRSPAKAPKVAPPRPVENLYHAQVSGDVTVTQGAQTLTSDTAEVWFRLIDNALPAGAIAQTDSPPPARVAGTTNNAVPPSGATGQPPKSGSGPSLPTVDRSQPTRLAWTGPLEIRPLSQTPAMLARNHAFVRFASAREAGVRLADGESDSRGSGMQLDYSATTREVVLAATAEHPAELERPGVGKAIAARFDGSLATEHVHIPGAGTIIGSSPDGPDQPPRRATWTAEADFTFVREAKSNDPLLQQARLSGNAVASDASGSIAANQVVAVFTPVAGESAINQITAVGNAAAKDATGAGISGDHIEAKFTVLDSGESFPNTVTITGHARGQQNGNSLTAERIEATLATLDGDTVAEKLVASGAATFTGAKGEHAAGPLITAYPQRQAVELEGQGASVGRGESTVHGSRLALDGLDRTLEVVGPGTIDHTGPLGGDDAPTHASVAWTDGLWFDDVAGVARCVGDANAVITRGPNDTDKLAAGVILVELEPQAKEPATPNKQPGEDRRLSTLDAIGEGAPATVEIRRYRPGVSPPLLERLMYLEGVKIHADNNAGTLRVPSPGKLLVMDRREARADAPVRSQADAAGEFGHGTALFTWRESLALDRVTGEIRMTDGVRLIHDRGDGSPKTALDSDWLTAKIRQHEPGPQPIAANGEFDAELLSASAGNRVHLSSGTREITAATLEYDAISATVDANGGPGLVTLTDRSGKAQPAKAARILWYLKTDRIEATGVKPIVAPK